MPIFGASTVAANLVGLGIYTQWSGVELCGIDSGDQLFFEN